MHPTLDSYRLVKLLLIHLAEHTCPTLSLLPYGIFRKFLGYFFYFSDQTWKRGPLLIKHLSHKGLLSYRSLKEWMPLTFAWESIPNPAFSLEAPALIAPLENTRVLPEISSASSFYNVGVGLWLSVLSLITQPYFKKVAAVSLLLISVFYWGYQRGKSLDPLSALPSENIPNLEKELQSLQATLSDIQTHMVRVDRALKPTQNQAPQVCLQLSLPLKASELLTTPAFFHIQKEAQPRPVESLAVSL
jgi:hypothetical protein